MMRLFLFGLLCAASLHAAPPIAEKVKGLERRDGFIPFYWDAANGKIWLEIGRWNQEMLYVNSLPAGIGSNDIGLDRGQLGRTRIVRFERFGPRVLLVEPNYGFRASSESAAERRAVRESFAESVLWGFDVAAEEQGRALVDATAFFLRDAHGVAETLQRARQGSWRVDASRSALYEERTKNFPQNTEVEALVTLAGGPAGAWLRQVAPSPDSVTVRQHHSFVALPPPGYRPREFDPRAGYFPVSYYDFSAPVGEPLVKRFIRRHRLQKKDPAASSSDPVRPITYYLDPGAPEPIRTALLEGARWWSDAFEAAGFRNAFRVELLPEDADPMDVRYNVIQWVHRSTRGWSYGASVSDPRTGEIIKGHVTLGSLRVRQDFLIAEAYLAPWAAGAQSGQMLAMSLDRLRQLSAHEVGHTLGLGHNYIASTRGRASVMDYPHPFIDLDSAGVPTFRDAYAKGAGEWDKVSIEWGYREFAPGENERAALDQILARAEKRGLVFLTDQDARPEGSAHPDVHLWDNGASAIDELNRMMKVRAAALARFGENNIRPGEPMALLEDVLAPLYFGHRYQLEAAVKTIGGLRYRYALRGDGQTPVEPVPAAEQRRALDAVLNTVSAQNLLLPARIVNLIPPRPAGYPQTRELFNGRTGMTFDPVAAAESAASMAFTLLLHPQRATRLAVHHAADPAQPSLTEVLRRITAATWMKPRAAGAAAEIERAVNLAMLRSLMALAASEEASGQARALASAELRRLKAWLQSPAPTEDETAHRRFGADQIALFEKDPKQIGLPRPPDPPPGMPIGMDAACGALWR
jgi:hypothetical protein